ncbi:MAG: division/cell wall cluster transcriptional repressor MraZ [Bacteroidales bacterium]|nr:division/cell wall cluster transcriptional repressor MraZ [Bacteroidales bacterium]
MTNFIGDYTGKIDSKGRIYFPVPFQKQMSGKRTNHFVVKKDIFENCLVIFPYDEWQKQVELIRSRLNPYNKTHNLFLRKFYKDTIEVTLDSANRLLIPKKLLEIALINTEIILVGQDNKIEIWNAEQLDTKDISQDDFAKLAEEIFKEDPK